MNHSVRNGRDFTDHGFSSLSIQVPSKIKLILKKCSFLYGSTYSFIYLAASGLTCGRRDLQLQHARSSSPTEVSCVGSAESPRTTREVPFMAVLLITTD